MTTSNAPIDQRQHTLMLRYERLAAALPQLTKTGGDVPRLMELLARTADEFLKWEYIKQERVKEHGK